MLGNPKKNLSTLHWRIWKMFANRKILLVGRAKAQSIISNPNAPQELVNAAKKTYDKTEAALSFQDAIMRQSQKDLTQKQQQTQPQQGLSQDQSAQMMAQNNQQPEAQKPETPNPIM